MLLRSLLACVRVLFAACVDVDNVCVCVCAGMYKMLVVNNPVIKPRVSAKIMKVIKTQIIGFFWVGEMDHFYGFLEQRGMSEGWRGVSEREEKKTKEKERR